MKKQFFFSMLAAAAMLASCSSDNEVAQNNKEFFENGEGYVSFAINLPSTPTTRANDTFDDGLPSEYRVNDATLILFAGADEANATFNQAYTLKSAAWNNVSDDPNQITVTRQITQKIKSASGNLYAFVVLNKNGIFEVTTGDKLSVGGSDFTGKISDLQDLISAADFTANGILMMNAPLSKLPGTSTSANPGATGYGITTLAPVTAANIKPTAAEAEANPAAKIYVERAVAKTTVTATASGSFTASGGATINYTINGWKLDNTKKSSYLAHKCDATEASLSLISPKSGSFYRMAGNAVVETGAGYRYYWAIDPDYSSDIADADVNRLYGTTPTWNALSTTVPEYCKENTFDVAHQVYKNTTSVLIKATLNGGTTFYTVNDENKVYDEAGYKAAFASVYLSRSEIASWLSANLADGKSHTLTASDFTFAYSTDANNQITVTGVTVASSSALITESKLKTGYDTNLSTVNSTVLSIVNETKVLVYTNGATYYEARVKHFGDDLTPWNTWETTNKPTAASAYNGADATDINNRYLGRYGMVRNNWYAVTIDGITKIGSPVIPNISADGTTDDNLDSYISVKINVLSWAKRTQSVTL